jgi:hypothetical protein
MTLGERLGQRLGSLSSGRLKLAALAVLLVYAIVMLWPYLAATLVRGSAVTAWVNLATAPIPGRAPVQLPLVGSHVGADGVIVELINEQLDPGMVPRAEAVLTAAQARSRAARFYLEGMLEIDGDRRQLMKDYAAQFRSELDADIAAREARLGLLRTKVAAAGQLAERTKNVADRGYRSGDYRDDAQIRLAEAEAGDGSLKDGRAHRRAGRPRARARQGRRARFRLCRHAAHAGLRCRFAHQSR